MQAVVLGSGEMKRRSGKLGVAQLASLLCRVASASGALALPAAPWLSLVCGQVPVAWPPEPPFHSAYQGPNSLRGPPQELERAPNGSRSAHADSPPADGPGCEVEDGPESIVEVYDLAELMARLGLAAD